MSKWPRVRIVSASHPHSGETGRLNIEDNIPATKQAYVELDNCPHGMQGCYVTAQEIIKLK